jgi:hypothetical protein
MRVVQTVARFRSIGYEIDKIARKLNKPAVTVRRVNRAGLDAIAAGLRRDGAAVFYEHTATAVAARGLVRSSALPAPYVTIMLL